VHIAITGASSGIGAALAKEFAAPGAKLTLVARRLPLLEALAETLRAKGAEVRLVQHDLSVPARAADWIGAAEEAFGPLEVLINNAGAQVVAATATTDVERAEQTVLLNLLTPLRLTRAVLPGMLQRKRGCIVDVSSLAGIAPTPGMTWYNAGKGGLGAASEALRGELRGSGVHVVTVYPGPVSSDMAHAAVAAFEGGLAARIPMGDAATLARLVRRAVQKRRARVIYPAPYALARWFPISTRWLMDRFSPKPRA
jgi:short-subunit dehydrogenase